MKIGYACQTVGIDNMQQKSCIQKNATPERLEELIDHNLNVLERMIVYNIRQGIQMLRISSDIIPFGSSPVNTLHWQRLFQKKLAAIGSTAKKHNIRLSMHPGQYTVLNSPSDDVVARAVKDLQYHSDFLDTLGLDESHKLTLHIGGIYGDKTAAIQRFLNTYQSLPTEIKKRLIIENDDKLYTIEDVLQIGEAGKIPVVFDNLHHQLNHSDKMKTDQEWLRQCRETWSSKDGSQKIHYSQQAEGKKPGSHSDTIAVAAFTAFYETLPHELDIMLEVKDKNLSAIKCINTVQHNEIKYLEQEWSRYKYLVLEKDPAAYQKIRNLLKDKARCPSIAFYQLIETAMKKAVVNGNAVNAAEHVWGYFKKQSTEKEKTQFEKALKAYQNETGTLSAVKRILYKLARQYEESYLINSYYFLT